MWDKFKILNELRIPNPYILTILLLCKSNTYSFVSYAIFFIFVIEFLGSRRTFNVGIAFAKFYISFSWLSNKSIYIRFGREIKFSIFVIRLCWNVSIFNFYSPSSKGTWASYKLSRHNRSMFVSLYTGLR